MLTDDRRMTLINTESEMLSSTGQDRYRRALDKTVPPYSGKFVLESVTDLLRNATGCFAIYSAGAYPGTFFTSILIFQIHAS